MGKRLYRDIEIRGVVYPTAAAAAKALGVTEGTVCRAIHAGTLHRCGTGASHPEPMPVRIRGKVYRDAHHAARVLGVTPGGVYQALSKDDPDRVGAGRRPRNGARPVTIGPLRFPSMAQASRDLGFGAEYVSQVLRRNSMPGRQRLIAAAMALEARRASLSQPKETTDVAA